MNRKVLCLLLNFVLLMNSEFFNASSEAKKVIINVPYRVKNVKHTHTIYKIIPHYHKSKDHYHEAKDHDHEHIHDHEYIHESEDLDYYR